ncbi:MAG: phiCDHM11 [Haloplasmataceae bacterium]|jgi:DNA polymerase III epsilon subunit family exonuclease|nr:phiCDHM11 [Haloplasmataceae bacterium]
MRNVSKKVSGKNKFQYLQFHDVVKTFTNFVVFDVETTGVDNFEYREIIQISAIRFRNNVEIEEFNSYVKPKNPIPKDIQERTGITPSLVADAPSIDSTLPRFLDFIGDDVLVAHNSKFDMRFLLYNMFILEIPYKEFYVVDTMQFAQNYIKQENGNPFKNYDLPNLVKKLGLDFDDEFSPHDALEDSRMTGRLYIVLNETALAKVSNESPNYEYINKVVERKRNEYMLSLIRDASISN